MPDLRIESTRGDLVESVHRVAVVVVDAQDRLVAHAGEHTMVTFWRSAAKPFQAMPIVADGAADRFQLDDRELALCCASHSSETAHLETTDRILAKIGLTESSLACGPHMPLSPRIAEEVQHLGIRLTPRWSNCSGKHSGMLALARHHDWPTDGYNREEHPVQQRILDEVVRWTGAPRPRVHLSVDGCNTVCFGLPLRGMALAYARFGVSTEPAAARLRRAMTEHADMVGGTGRPCTDLMRALGGKLVAKVGAEGVYSASVVLLGLGIALKVEDGDMRSAPIALIAVLRQVLEWFKTDATALETCRRHAEATIKNTRGLTVGTLRAAGGLTFV